MASAPATKPLKSILKKPASTAPSSSSSPPAAPSTPRDPRAGALHHASPLQARHDTEALLFEHTLELLDLPRHGAPAAAPHPADAARFAALVRLFQPADYDGLVAERNRATDAHAAGRCGYALCPRPRRRRARGAGAYALVNKGRRDFAIVATAELERWCSAACTRRALWVRLQLCETAAWERAALPALRIELYPETTEAGGKEDRKGAAGGRGRGRGDDDDDDAEKLAADMAGLQLGQGCDGGEQLLADSMAGLQLERDHKAARDKAALAVERGDDAKGASTRSVAVLVREKTVFTTQVQAPSLGDEPVDGNTIEGYKPKLGGNRHAENQESGQERDVN